MIQERCLQCIDWSALSWPKPLWQRLWLTGWIGVFLTVSSVLMLLFGVLDPPEIPWPYWRWVLSSIGAVGGLFYLSHFIHGLSKRGWRGFRADLIGETFFLSVDTEHRLHVHRHEVTHRDTFAWHSSWSCSPCLIGTDRAGESGRTVARQKNTALVKLNVAWPRLCQIYGEPASRWRVSYDGHRLAFIDKGRNTLAIPLRETAVVLETLRLINEYVFITQIYQRALADLTTGSNPIAGKVGG